MERKAFVVKAISNDVPGYSVPGVYESLVAGRARIGWSYEDDLDLSILAARIKDGKWNELSEEQRNAWRCHGFLDRINVDEAAQRGDYLVYPHQPEYGKFMIVEATGPYQFAVAGDSLSGDFRSYRTCRPVTPAPIDWYDPIVPPRIKSKLGLQGRFYQLYDFDLFSQMLGSLPNAGAAARAGLSPRLGRIASEVMPKIPSLIWREFPRQDLSWLCNELFNRMGYSTVLQEGAGEAGSDLVVNVGSPLLPRPLTVGVQVFAYEGNVAGSCLQVKLQQLVGGWQANQLDYGVLLTTGNCGSECAELIAAHNKAHTDRPVVLIEGQMLSKLFIRYLLFDSRDE